MSVVGVSIQGVAGNFSHAQRRMGRRHVYPIRQRTQVFPAGSINGGAIAKWCLVTTVGITMAIFALFLMFGVPVIGGCLWGIALSAGAVLIGQIITGVGLFFFVGFIVSIICMSLFFSSAKLARSVFNHHFVVPKQIARANGGE